MVTLPLPMDSAPGRPTLIVPPAAVALIVPIMPIARHRPPIQEHRTVWLDAVDEHGAAADDGLAGVGVVLVQDERSRVLLDEIAIVGAINQSADYGSKSGHVQGQR